MTVNGPAFSRPAGQLTEVFASLIFHLHKNTCRLCPICQYVRDKTQIVMKYPCKKNVALFWISLKWGGGNKSLNLAELG